MIQGSDLTQISSVLHALICVYMCVCISFHAILSHVQIDQHTPESTPQAFSFKHNIEIGRFDFENDLIENSIEVLVLELTGFNFPLD